jgi:hypothetical protein
MAFEWVLVDCFTSLLFGLWNLGLLGISKFIQKVSDFIQILNAVSDLHPISRSFAGTMWHPEEDPFGLLNVHRLSSEKCLAESQRRSENEFCFTDEMIEKNVNEMDLRKSEMKIEIEEKIRGEDRLDV